MNDPLVITKPNQQDVQLDKKFFIPSWIIEKMHQLNIRLDIIVIFSLTIKLYMQTITYADKKQTLININQQMPLKIAVMLQ